MNVLFNIFSTYRERILNDPQNPLRISFLSLTAYYSFVAFIFFIHNKKPISTFQINVNSITFFTTFGHCVKIWVNNLSNEIKSQAIYFILMFLNGVNQSTSHHTQTIQKKNMKRITLFWWRWWIVTHIRSIQSSMWLCWLILLEHRVHVRFSWHFWLLIYCWHNETFGGLFRIDSLQ